MPTLPPPSYLPSAPSPPFCPTLFTREHVQRLLRRWRRRQADLHERVSMPVQKLPPPLSRHPTTTTSSPFPQPNSVFGHLDKHRRTDRQRGLVDPFHFALKMSDQRCWTKSRQWRTSWRRAQYNNTLTVVTHIPGKNINNHCVRLCCPPVATISVQGSPRGSDQVYLSPGARVVPWPPGQVVIGH
ncbi:unnamed protein product [Pleuronectes platessa]|uniref:Uncharacterized protein n=1 Tax=Pleuronectes platessa TaxID=8262 RepID=A0A9N7VF78_PLEPL|nr:unnamed protein product [Pleuronectes platessa]